MAMKSFTGKVSLDIFFHPSLVFYHFFNRKMGKCFQFHICYLILEKDFLFYRNGNAVGYLSRGGFGYSINKSLGTGYVDLQA
jgi:glycine cleavage system aminomethyltransferase T